MGAAETAGQPSATDGAVILAGGRGRRLGGVDKPGLVVGGRTLLDTAVDACAACAEIVVVGPPKATSRPVSWTMEEPPGGGPLAALAAGIRALPGRVDTITVLAADLPQVTRDVIAVLREALESSGVDAALLVDDAGRLQPLTAVYRRTALTSAIAAAGDLHGQPLRLLLSELSITTRTHARAAEDIDTHSDLARWTSGAGSDPPATPPYPEPRKDSP